jgi:hypothetical protein
MTEFEGMFKKQEDEIVDIGILYSEFRNPSNPEFPELAERYKTQPTLPRSLFEDFSYFGDKINKMYMAKTYEEIISLMTEYVEGTNISHMQWRTVRMVPAHSMPQSYGDTSDLGSFMTKWYEARGQGTNRGLYFTRGDFENGLKSFKALYAANLEQALDSIRRFAQMSVLGTVLNVPDQLEAEIVDFGNPEDKTVAEFHTDYETYNCVNIFRENFGFRKLISRMQRKLNRYYVDRAKQNPGKNWMILMTPEMREFMMDEKDENWMFLFTGMDRGFSKNEKTVYEYLSSGTKANVIMEAPRFWTRGENFGKIVLKRSVEHSCFYVLNSKTKADILVIHDGDKGHINLKYKDARDIISGNPKLFGFTDEGQESGTDYWDDDSDFDNNYDILVLKRRVFTTHSLLYMLQNCITQFSTKMWITGGQNTDNGDVHLTMYKKFTEVIKNQKDVFIAKDVLITNCNQKGTSFKVVQKNVWKNQMAETEMEELAKCNMFVVPINKDVYSNSYPDMIDRIGYDDTARYRKVVLKLKEDQGNGDFNVKANETRNKMYFEKYRQTASLYDWSEHGQESSEFYYFFCNIRREFRPCSEHWQGYQLSKSVEGKFTETAETGPLALCGGKWWTTKQPIIRTKAEASKPSNTDLFKEAIKVGDPVN